MAGPSPTPPPFRQPNVEKRADDPWGDPKTWLGCGAAILFVIVSASLARSCNSGGTANNTAAFVDGNVSNAIAARPPPSPQPLRIAAVNRGTGHLRVAVNADGFSGAMIYSQNCYDALGRQFTWAKLDTCGAFDMLAVRSIADADTANFANEAGYFQSEAAAGRYLAAATAAGQQAGEADTRLSDLQTRVRRAPLAGRRPAPEASNSIVSNSSGNLLDAPLDDLSEGEE